MCISQHFAFGQRKFLPDEQFLRSESNMNPNSHLQVAWVDADGKQTCSQPPFIISQGPGVQKIVKYEYMLIFHKRKYKYFYS